MKFENSLHFARSLDSADALASFRNKFIIPEKDGIQQIYFLGNSLGLQPKTISIYIQQVLNEWARYGVEGFFEGTDPWINYHDKLTKTLSGLVGALPHEVVVMNQLTVNLHLLMVSFYRPVGRRTKIICEAKAFPSDQYMLETYLKHLGLTPEDIIIEVAPKRGEHLISTQDIVDAITLHREELALVFLGGVNYYTGQLFDMRTITAAAHEAGAIAGYDLAHAVGNVPLELNKWNVDFACWCSYKYLNSGPGAVGAAYVNKRFHSAVDLPRFGGWWGYNKDTRFKMEKGFIPINTAEGWQLSTPPIILLACHKAALDVFQQAGLDIVFSKGRQLSNYLHFTLAEVNKQHGSKIIRVITPAVESERGCQVSMLVENNGRNIFENLSKHGVFADWREPNVIRVAPVPLYNSFEEVWRFGEILHNAF